MGAGILPMCTPWDESSLKKLEAWGMQAYKVASADFTNIPLLEKLSETNKSNFPPSGRNPKFCPLNKVSWTSTLHSGYIEIDLGV